MKSRIYTLKIYFTDTPSPLIVDNVRHIQTEGNLLRLIFQKEDGSRVSNWWPLTQIHTIQELAQEDK